MKATGIAMWAMLTTPDTKFEPMWKITLILSDAEAKKLRDAGLKVKRNDETGVPEFKFTRKVANKKGGDNPAPRVVDAAKNLFNGNVGNGSIVNVQFTPFSWEFRGKKGVSADLVAVQIIDLVPFGGDSQVDEFEILSGDDEFSNETEAPSGVGDDF